MDIQITRVIKLAFKRFGPAHYTFKLIEGLKTATTLADTVGLTKP